MSTKPKEKLFWDDPKFSEAYKQAEKITGPYGQLLLDQAKLKQYASAHENLAVLDDACGTGVVSSKIIAALSADEKAKLSLTCLDFSDSMVDFTKNRSSTESWPAEVMKADAQDTKLPSGSFSHAFFNFGPGLLPDPDRGVSEVFRMLQPGGTFGCTGWKDVPWMRDVAEAFEQHPELPEYPPGDKIWTVFSEKGTEWIKEGSIIAALERAGFADVKVTLHTRNHTLDSIEEFIHLMPGSMSMLFKLWTEEEKERHTKAANEVVVDYMKQKYGGGPVHRTWSAFVATAQKPA